ncbi:MAG TPA: ATP-binding protein [Candidatus Binatia bacterium]|nr:ATP-binding protein [Candidatus Binatia bacterium]
MSALESAGTRTPVTVEDTGIRRKLLEDLALKTVYVLGELGLRELADHMCISFRIVEELFQRLRKDQLCQVTGMAGGVHRIVSTSEGKARALELMSLSQYVGPVPVSLDAYVARVREQTVRGLEVDPQGVARAFERLVLDPETLTQLGTAVISGKAIFLYGPSGTGKTSVAETLWRLFRESDDILVPHAIEVDGQIISVYDPGVHETSDAPAPPDHDRRWMLCKRPRVVVGGELTIEMLDLEFNPLTKFYSAPVQMKANNGLLIIDDFGRQRVRPEELLNRWVVPLDRSLDFLTLTGGKKIEVPFDMLVVFATNLDPATLVDEAFLRRIQTKIRLESVSEQQFHEIARRVCGDLKIDYVGGTIDHLIQMITRDLQQPLRACHPRDIISQVSWGARYEKRTPRLDREAVEVACRAYFLSPR